MANIGEEWRFLRALKVHHSQPKIVHIKKS